MKKLIFLLLLAQAIAFLYADSGCIAYTKYQGSEGVSSDPSDPSAWRWGIKAPKKVKCYCNCAKYLKQGNKCIECRHFHIPVDLKISTNSCTSCSVSTESMPHTPTQDTDSLQSS